jgi:hypothetical protein
VPLVSFDEKDPDFARFLIKNEDSPEPTFEKVPEIK